MNKTNFNCFVYLIKRDTCNGIFLANNVQRVGLRLLQTNGEWVPRHQLNKIPSGVTRVRDLRKSKYGGFRVECKSSVELNKRTSKKTYYYRIIPSEVTQAQLIKLFGN